MAKSVPIKWRETDAKNLQRAVKNFNAKRTMLIKKNPLIEGFLPAPKRVKELREVIETRADFNRHIKFLQTFTKEGYGKLIIMENGVKTTTLEAKFVTNAVKRINKQRKAELEKLNPSYEKGNMHTVEEMALQPKPLPKDARISNWEAYVRNVEIQSSQRYFDKKKEQYKANYLKALDEEFGGLPDSKKIRQLVSGLSATQVVDAVYTDTFLEIDFIYSPEDVQKRVETIWEHWLRYVGSV